MTIEREDDDRDPDDLGVGEQIRRQRELAALPLRQLAAMSGISNPYLSQIENGLRAPSDAVLESIADSLRVQREFFTGGLDAVEPSGRDPAPGASDSSAEGPARTRESDEGVDPEGGADPVAAIRADPGLTVAQRNALVETYVAMRETTDARRRRRGGKPRG